MAIGSLKIVCYAGGTCGDLLTALIDSTDASINTELGTVQHNSSRQRLKKPHLFNSLKDKNDYLISMQHQYHSVPSHDLDFHTQQQHDFITITVNELDVAIWAATRFKHCHRPQVWQSMTEFCGADDIRGYAQVILDYSRMVSRLSKKIMPLEVILSGGAVSFLENLLNTTLPVDNHMFYQQWLSCQKS